MKKLYIAIALLILLLIIYLINMFILDRIDKASNIYKESISDISRDYISEKSSKMFIEQSSAQKELEIEKKSDTENTELKSKQETIKSFPVVNVSESYAYSAEKIFSSFYCAGEVAPNYIFIEPLVKVIKGWIPDYLKEYDIFLMNKYCFFLYDIDPYFVDFKTIGKMIIDKVPFDKVLELCELESANFYDNNVHIGILCGSSENNMIFGEVMYTRKNSRQSISIDENLFIYNKSRDGHLVPERALFLDDVLMNKLVNAGFVLDKTEAMSVNIPTHSTGIYFYDGAIGRYYPLTLAENSKFLTVNEMSDIYVLGESLIEHEYSSVN